MLAELANLGVNCFEGACPLLPFLCLHPFLFLLHLKFSLELFKTPQIIFTARFLLSDMFAPQLFLIQHHFSNRRTRPICSFRMRLCPRRRWHLSLVPLLLDLSCLSQSLTLS